ncbi:hypothetical protein D3C85_1839230 [compost metagenome]
MAALLGGIQFQLHLLNVKQLLLQLQAPLGDLLQHDVELIVVVTLRIVELDQALALG